MYVVTFYSFKGGVGRSMALVNVAAELAQAGRKVLIVDFDLEAPGIPEFGLRKPEYLSKGIVEFVSDYLVSLEVPKIEDYVYRSNTFERSGGELLIMPAGVQDESYQERFAAINWQQLYDENHGFLLMEDMRLQWQETLGVEYVFIDSRTGYTDIAGICTRQLPDAVCMIFVPNRQNLNGVTRVANEIKAQHKISGLRHPKLHYVPSNVPNLGDDKELLSNAYKMFSQQLQYEKPCAIINHFDSFALLTEEVFALCHPTAKLTEQYQALTREITKSNFQDKVSALSFLRAATFDYPNAGEALSPLDVERRESEIANYFGHDPEVLYWMSRLSRAGGNFEASRERLEYAINNGLNLPRAFLDRALMLEREDNFVGAAADIEKALSMVDNITPSEVLLAIHLSLAFKNSPIEYLIESPALKSLSAEDLIFICQKTNYSKAGVKLTAKILERVLENPNLTADELENVRILHANGFIATGNLGVARDLYSQMYEDSGISKFIATFNLGMICYWLGEKSKAASYFAECLPVFETINSPDNNILQCKTFALWGAGNEDAAQQGLQELQSKITKDGSARIYSCWRYLEVSPTQFSVDLQSMSDYFNTGNGKPGFLN